MVTLRGNADLAGKNLPDEPGTPIVCPRGALHVQAAVGYAKELAKTPTRIPTSRAFYLLRHSGPSHTGAHGDALSQVVPVRNDR